MTEPSSASRGSASATRSARPGRKTLRSSLSAVPRRRCSGSKAGTRAAKSSGRFATSTWRSPQGDVVGLVGRNGAGKSTLLKILSRIVEPTTGRAILDGRVASLLEVGTGFHQELTGRENIYLNGAILGMRRREIQAKFDEIVEFSEVEKFLDTPVKRYSSGMYVRLAFAVAAHLEPDILIVDEVLAVGDAEFQKKSLGKMSSVARAGRTVIFVSHNTTPLLDLCNHGVLLESGRLALTGSIEEVVAAYTQRNAERGNGRFRRPDSIPPRSWSSRPTCRTRRERRPASSPTARRYAYASRRALRRARASAWSSGSRTCSGSRSPTQAAGSLGASASEAARRSTSRCRRCSLAEGTYSIDFICRGSEMGYLDIWFEDVTFNVVDTQPGASPMRLRASDELGTVVIEDASFEVLK